MIERDKDVGQQFMRILDEVHKRVIGMDEAIETILVAIFSGGHVLLESVPGMGKTMMSRTIADALDCSFKRVQCTADLAPKDLIGDAVYDDKEGKYVLRKGPIFANILLIDEINRLELWIDLKCVHVNDSRDPFNSGRDRHANLGEGLVPRADLRYFLNQRHLRHLPLILEVPGFDGDGPDARNVELLRRLLR